MCRLEVAPSDRFAAPAVRLQTELPCESGITEMMGRSEAMQRQILNRLASVEYHPLEKVASILCEEKGRPSSGENRVPLLRERLQTSACICPTSCRDHRHSSEQKGVQPSTETGVRSSEELGVQSAVKIGVKFATERGVQSSKGKGFRSPGESGYNFCSRLTCYHS